MDFENSGKNSEAKRTCLIDGTFERKRFESRKGKGPFHYPDEGGALRSTFRRDLRKNFAQAPENPMGQLFAGRKSEFQLLAGFDAGRNFRQRRRARTLPQKAHESFKKVL